MADVADSTIRQCVRCSSPREFDTRCRPVAKSQPPLAEIALKTPNPVRNTLNEMTAKSGYKPVATRPEPSRRFSVAPIMGWAYVFFSPRKM